MTTWVKTEHANIYRSQDGKLMCATIKVDCKMHEKVVRLTETTNEHQAVIYLNRWMGCVRFASRRYHAKHAVPRKYKSQYMLWLTTPQGVSA